MVNFSMVKCVGSTNYSKFVTDCCYTMVHTKNGDSVETATGEFFGVNKYYNHRSYDGEFSFELVIY